MRGKFFKISFTLLILLNLALLWQNRSLKNREFHQSSAKDYEIEIDGVSTDIRGLYTYPGFLKWLKPDVLPQDGATAPLTLAIFFSQASKCPSRLHELEVYRRLLPIFEQRGQRIVAIAAPSDSQFVSQGLAADTLGIPLVIYDNDDSTGLGLTFHALGISPENMPVKILYDSTLTAIYIRGADFTPESQFDFEKAAIRLSELIYTGKL